MSSQVSDFKGNPVLCLREFEEDDRPFMFGKRKAKLILQELSAIQEFVKDEQK